MTGPATQNWPGSWLSHHYTWRVSLALWLVLKERKEMLIHRGAEESLDSYTVNLPCAYLGAPALETLDALPII